MTNELPLPDNAILRVACICGHTHVYESVNAFENEGGRLHYESDTDLFAAQCPACSGKRPVKTGVFDYSESPDEICLVFGEFESDYDPLDDLSGAYDPNQTAFPALDPLKLGQQRMDPACVECRTPLTESDLKSGPDEPELGWEYYECSACGARMRPGSVK